MSDLITLKVKDVVKETSQASTIHFKQPLFKKVKYKPGQFITLSLQVNGKQVMRSYSMCSAPQLDNTVAVTVKRVEDGLVSNYINDQLKPGDSIKVIQPKGNFTLEPDKNNKRHIVLFGAGSGITPLMSIIKSVLFFEPDSTVSLVYGNRDQNSVIFKGQLENLKEKFSGRFNLVYVYSQPENQWNGYKGRIDKTLTVNVINLLPKFPPTDTEYYICGPDGMMEVIKEGLKFLKVPKDKIHSESFTSSNESEEAVSGLGELQPRDVTIVLRGETHQVMVPPNKSILEAALDDGLDMPFSCQSGLCTACMGKRLEGEVKMSDGDGLSDDEINEGYVLLCVGHPTSDNVKVEVD